MVTIRKTLFIGLIILALFLVACDRSEDINATEETPFEEAAEVILDIPVVDNTCPHECCTEDDDFDEKGCEFDKPCINNRCVFERCPYDCCSGYGDKYERKKCKAGHECIDDDCVPIDDDGDGLLNIEEEELETDPDNPDTDGDGLSDFEEVKRTKTDPLDDNMDGDRYNDKEDANPFIGAFPVVHVELTSDYQTSDKGNLETLEQAYTDNCEGRVCNVAEILLITGDLELFTSEFTIERENVGDDYTEYTEFKISIYTIDGGKRWRIYPTIEDRMETLDDGDSDERDYEYVIKLSDLEIGGEGVLISAALESDRFVILPEVRNVETEGEQ